MGDSANKDDIPTFHANIVTSTLDVDELTMELRWFHVAHRDSVEGLGDEVIQLPAADASTILSVPPTARMVLTFSAARALKKFLDSALPQAEKSRESQ